MQSPVRFMFNFQREPPVEVLNLFTDIQDGRLLMALLEELTGCRLVRNREYNIFI